MHSTWRVDACAKRWGCNVSNPVKTFLRSGWQMLAKKAARAYISGPELEDALRSCQQLSRLGLGSTVCYWNLADDTPRQVADACIAAAKSLTQERIDGYLSVKLPPLRFDYGELERILAAAAPGLLVHFDAHGPDTATATFAAIAHAAAIRRPLGCTLPGRWQRSRADADWAVDLGLHVRVVKGQWADTERPDIDPRAGYLRLIDGLAGRAHSVAVATHDPQLGRQALRRLLDAGTPCFLELLYGLPVAAPLAIARELQVPVRVYIPFGYGWLPYSLGQARRNPRLLWWVLRDLAARNSLLGASRLRQDAPATSGTPAEGAKARSL